MRGSVNRGAAATRAHSTLRLAHGLLCIALLLVSFSLFYPGFLTSDSAGQLLEARAGIYSDWHPPFMAWIWRQVDAHIPGPAGMLALQLVLICAGITLIVSRLVPARIGAQAAAAIALLLFPPVLAWAGAVTKDTLMLGAALVGTGGLLHGGQSPSPKAARGWFFAAFAALTLACTVRHNGLVLALGLAWIPAASARPPRSWRRLLPLTVALMLLPAVVGVATNRLLTDRPSYAVASVLAFDVAGIAMRHAEAPDFTARYATAAQQALLRPGHRLSELGAWYRATDWMALASPVAGRGDPPVWSHWDAAHTQNLRVFWRDLVSAYPLDYLAHRRSLISALLATGTLTPIDPVCMSSERIRAPFGNRLRDITYERSPVQKIMAWRLARLIESISLFHPWFAYLLAVSLLALCCWRRLPNRALAGALLGSGLAHETALFLLAPAAEYRYSAWLFVATAIAVLAMLGGLLRGPYFEDVSRQSP